MINIRKKLCVTRLYKAAIIEFLLKVRSRWPATFLTHGVHCTKCTLTWPNMIINCDVTETSSLCSIHV